MSNTTYTTKGGERWDTIAREAYGDPFRTSEIIRANPHIPNWLSFPTGITVNVPISETPASQTITPPWK